MVKVHCDNEAVVEMLKKGYSRDEYLMHLLRCMFFGTAWYDFCLRPVHISGARNVVADAISRNNLSVLQSQVPELGAMAPATIIPAVSGLLIQQIPDWTSTDWSRLFSNYLRQE